MLFRIYIESYLPSGERLHVVEVNVQWWRYISALYSVAPNTMARPVTKTSCGWEQRHVNGYMLGRLREQTKWPSGAPIRLHSNSISSWRDCFTRNKTWFKWSNCSAEAICTSSWLIRYCLEKLNQIHTHTHTHAHTTTVILGHCAPSVNNVVTAHYHVTVTILVRQPLPLRCYYCAIVMDPSGLCNCSKVEAGVWD